MTTGTGGTLVLGPEAGSGFGSRVVALGDVNGDGRDDFAVSAPLAANGYDGVPGTDAEVGLTFVFYGGTFDLAATIDLAFAGGIAPDGVLFSAVQGDLALGQIGSVLTAAGDVDGDGYDDVIAGSGDYGGAATDRVAVLLYGSAAGFGAVVDLGSLAAGSATRMTVSAGAGAGFHASGAGDLNGDGYVDMVIADPASAQSFVLFGDGAKHPASLGLTGSFGLQKDSYSNALGIFSAGDINHDGLDDLLLVTSQGSVVVFGSTTMGGTSQNALAFVPDGTNGVALGLSQVLRAEKVADINGDGIDDLLVEGRADTLSGGTETFVIFGRSGGFGATLDLTALDGTDGFSITGTGSTVGFGGTGDVNGDGLRDVIVADTSASGGAGAIYLIFGQIGGHTATLDPTTLDGVRGYRISGLAGDLAGGGQLADVNGDGFSDLILGLPGRGAAAILYGGPGRLAALDAADGALDGLLSLDHLGDTLTFTEPDPVPLGNGGTGSDPPTQFADDLTGTDGADYVDLLAGNDMFGAKAGDDSISGNLGDDQIFGDSGFDTLAGGAGSDRLDGGPGNDVLIGGTESDSLIGSVGDDVYHADDAGDHLLEIDGGGQDLVLASLDWTLGQFFEDLTFAGSGPLKGRGNGLANRLTGNDGRNSLHGLGGGDTLRGGAGADTVVGGGGTDRLHGGKDDVRDVFVFSAVRDSVAGLLRDVIENFARFVDDIDLRLIDANRAMDGNQAFHFTGSRQAAHSIWVAATGSGILVRGDVNGDGMQDFEVRLAGLSNITAGDFLL